MVLDGTDRAPHKVPPGLVCNAELHSFSFRSYPPPFSVVWWWWWGWLVGSLSEPTRPGIIIIISTTARPLVSFIISSFFSTFLFSLLENVKRKRQTVRREKRSRATPLRFVRVAFPSESLLPLYIASLFQWATRRLWELGDRSSTCQANVIKKQNK